MGRRLEICVVIPRFADHDAKTQRGYMIVYLCMNPDTEEIPMHQAFVTGILRTREGGVQGILYMFP